LQTPKRLRGSRVHKKIEQSLRQDEVAGPSDFRTREDDIDLNDRDVAHLSLDNISTNRNVQESQKMTRHGSVTKMVDQEN
jgi:hypothetical protein